MLAHDNTSPPSDGTVDLVLDDFEQHGRNVRHPRESPHAGRRTQLQLTPVCASETWAVGPNPRKYRRFLHTGNRR